MAKELLRKKGVIFKEIDVSCCRELRVEMSQKAGGRSTVPQIWIGGTHVGGCDDLYALEREGKLDVLLAA
jgi:glutaredoxin 3